MGFLRTSDFREGNEMVFFLMKLAFRENGIVVEKVDFKLSKIAIEVNYKENVSWSFRSLGSGSLGKGGDSGSSPRIGDNNIKDGYLPNRFCI